MQRLAIGYKVETWTIANKAEMDYRPQVETWTTDYKAKVDYRLQSKDMNSKKLQSRCQRKGFYTTTLLLLTLQ